MWVFVNIIFTIRKQHVLSMWTACGPHVNSLKSSLEGQKNKWGIAAACDFTHAVSPAQSLCADAAQ